MKRVFLAVLAGVIALFVSVGAEQTPGAADRMTTEVFDGMPLRSIGPTLTTGRVADIDVDP